MLVLHHGDTSTASAKVRLALSEKKLAYESRLYVLRRGEHKTPDYLAINPAGVVPTLVHDGTAIRESNVILEYLEDAFPEPPLLSASPHDRAHTRLLMRETDALHEAGSILSSAVKLAGMGANASAALDRIADPRKRERQMQLVQLGFEAPDIPHAIARYREAVEAAAIALQGSAFLSGADIGLADCAMLPYVHRADRLGLAQLWADAPDVAGWFERMRNRPSYDEAVLRFENASPYAPSPELIAAVRRFLHERAPGKS